MFTDAVEPDYYTKWKEIWEMIYRDPALNATHNRWMEEFKDNDGIEVRNTKQRLHTVNPYLVYFKYIRFISVDDRHYTNL